MRGWSMPVQLVTSDARGAAQLGGRVALSANGRTALVGAFADDGYQGSVYVFVHQGRSWVQQAHLRVSGTRGFSSSLALSADGNTALVGASASDDFVGSAWVFTRVGTHWREQARLHPSGEIGDGNFGWSVALSWNGKVALVGAPVDDAASGSTAGLGAAWVFVRAGSAWRQTGEKLVAPETTNGFGFAIAINSNGTQAVIGAPGYHAKAGAAWFLQQQQGAWQFVGGKITGTHESGHGEFGYAVAMSANGHAAMISASDDASGSNPLGAYGAVWTYVNHDGTWRQDGAKLISPKPQRPGSFGTSISITDNGKTALIGAAGERHLIGDVWIFTRSSAGWRGCASPILPPASAGAKDELGYSVATTPNATEALIGAPATNSRRGAAWLYTPPSSEKC